MNWEVGRVNWETEGIYWEVEQVNWEADQVNWEAGRVNWEAGGDEVGEGELESWRGNHTKIEPLLEGITRNQVMNQMVGGGGGEHKLVTKQYLGPSKG